MSYASRTTILQAGRGALRDLTKEVNTKDVARNAGRLSGVFKWDQQLAPEAWVGAEVVVGSPHLGWGGCRGPC